ncbi:MAG TPA: sulfotransferase [Gammaproteobacteria bacterium]|nr:sulfotransferase [Gammaproteobacteria bacterium]
MSNRPPLILVFGLPRSGTTWLGKIFDSHPDTLYRHEPDNYPRLEALPRFPSLHDADTYADFVGNFVSDLARRNDVTVAAKMPIFPKVWRGPIRQRLLQGAALAAKVGVRAGVNLPVLGARGDRIAPAPTIVWKSIESTGRFGLLMRVLPEARGIHLLRHPCGQINSVLRGERQGEFQDNSPTSEFFNLFRLLLETSQARRHGLSMKGLRRMRPEERLAWSWVITNEKAVEEAKESGRSRVVCYEDLCANPLAESRRLFDFAGLDWNAQTARFVRRSTDADAAAYYSVFKNPTHSVSRWREELPADSACRILAILQSSFLAEFYDESTPAGPGNQPLPETRSSGC